MRIRRFPQAKGVTSDPTKKHLSNEPVCLHNTRGFRRPAVDMSRSNMAETEDHLSDFQAFLIPFTSSQKIKTHKAVSESIFSSLFPA